MRLDLIRLGDVKRNLYHRCRWLLLTLMLLPSAALLILPAAAAAQPKSKIDPLVMPSRKAPVDMITSGMLLDIARAGKRLVAVGERGHIILSDDNGGTWQQAEVPVSVMLTGVHFPTAMKGWAVGYDGVVLHTTDGGKTWALQLSDTKTIDLMEAAYERLFNDTQSMVAGQKENNPELERKLEDMEFALGDWQNSREEEVCPPLMGAWFKNESVGMVYGAFGMLLRTEDGGATWQPVIDSLENFNGYHYYCLMPSGDNLFLVGEVGMIFRSADLGKTWTRLKTPFDGSYFGITVREQGPELVAYGLQGLVIRSVDEGENWTEIAETGGNLCGAVTTDHGDSFFIGPDGNVFKLARRTAALESIQNNFAFASTLIEVAPGELIGVGLQGIKIIQTKGSGG